MVTVVLLQRNLKCMVRIVKPCWVFIGEKDVKRDTRCWRLCPRESGCNLSEQAPQSPQIHLIKANKQRWHVCLIPAIFPIMRWAGGERGASGELGSWQASFGGTDTHVLSRCLFAHHMRSEALFTFMIQVLIYVRLILMKGMHWNCFIILSLNKNMWALRVYSNGGFCLIMFRIRLHCFVMSG